MVSLPCVPLRVFFAAVIHLIKDCRCFIWFLLPSLSDKAFDVDCLLELCSEWLMINEPCCVIYTVYDISVARKSWKPRSAVSQYLVSEPSCELRHH